MAGESEVAPILSHLRPPRPSSQIGALASLLSRRAGPTAATLTIAVDQDDGQHVVLAQHSCLARSGGKMLCNPAGREAAAMVRQRVTPTLASVGGADPIQTESSQGEKEGRRGLRVMMPACNVARAGPSSVGLLFREGSPSWQHHLQARGRTDVFRPCGLQQSEVGKESKRPIC